MTIELVMRANDQFYRALSLADVAAMERLWMASPDAVCAHPGALPLQGWDAIRASWKTLLENQGPLRVWASEVQARLFGQTAEVTCFENIDSGRLPGAGIVQARATNIYRRIGRAWKMLEHHAAPVRHNVASRLEPFSHN
jgi:ketosteroid isomerase-like protein